MIDSTPPSDRTHRTDKIATPSVRIPVTRFGSDRFSAQHSEALRAALAAQPEVRPEVVARGKLLAADPSYPSPEILRRIGAAILRSPDFTNEEA